MINIRIETKKTMSVHDFNYLCEIFSKSRFNFESELTFDKAFTLTGDMSHLSECAKNYYKNMIKSKCIDNLRVLNNKE